MKKALQVLAAIAAACSAIGGVDLQGIINILPENVAGVIAILPASAVALGHVVVLAGDYLDDGKKNDSFGRVKAVILPFLIAVACFGLPCCTGFVAGVTGQPVSAVPVQRVDKPEAEPFQVATTDVFKAELAAREARELGRPEPVNGLYNVGTVANAVGRVVDSGK